MKKTLLKIFLFILAIPLLTLLIVAIAFAISNRTNGRILTSGEQRKYLLYVPDSYDPSHPTPLVITLHGFAQWPANQMQVSKWNDLADEFGFIVVYPSGTGFPLRWRVSPDTSEPDGPEKEVAFITDLIDELENQYNIDSNRIYANGLSNGGGMSVLLGCRLSDHIAAIGGVAGAYVTPWVECNPERPVPMIVFHGLEDQVVPYQGASAETSRISLPELPTWVREYASLNGCNLAAKELTITSSVTAVQYMQCAQDAEVVFYTIADGGHSWPGGGKLPEWIVGKTSMDIDATRLIWEYFEVYSLNN